MKKTIIILAFIFMYNSMNAQIIDTMFMLCQYKHKNTIPRYSGSREETDTMNLEIGKNISKFYSYHNKIVDSLRIGYGAVPTPYKKTASRYIIYTDYVKNNITFADYSRMTTEMFKYTEKLENPKWNIHDETKKILSHTCKKATCRFRGRDYVAWYATDIPVSRGPYKFNGLPGLILEISDTESLFTFCTVVCCSFRKECNPDIYQFYRDKYSTVCIYFRHNSQSGNFASCFYGNCSNIRSYRRQQQK